ncbi:TetR/AcrR family transcriptional regulator [Tissierella carlieri]|jgi:TetR/AcrR family transcriptional repressor of nem operon|uniref:TetR/AcrR family transcriptional regulator n=1 Tax=Tissierella TaxID=41273 RepID=UPI002804AEE0|nr:TetR/AcrR family transcriptional regulator [uncultured Tissierella sp.]MDU5079961.1 TetR/AcrR family transcriptional regulator [Bacillota bacterium]
MSRNKYPEQTIEKILCVSGRLFSEKGFDKTSIQDIINELEMSKGAIYHHFKSKEEILDAITKKQLSYSNQMLKKLIKDTKANNGREKLVRILEATMSDEEAHSLDNVLMSQIKNPQFVVLGIKAGINSDAPILSEIIQEGIEDGSINTEFPNECAEIFMLLVNIWINPVLFNRNTSETLSRLKLLQMLMKQLGVDIVSDKLIKQILKRHSDIMEDKNE